MRLPVTIFFVAAFPALCQAGDVASIYADIRARSICVENLKGLGSASLIFDIPTKSGHTENPTMNEEFNWDAQLVTTTGQIVRVQLHCTRIELRPQPEKGITEPSVGYMSELARL